MARTVDGRLLEERAVDWGSDRKQASRTGRPARSVTVNLVESPLGWPLARGHLSQRQFDAGERLRTDWKKAQLAPRITMAWDAAPIGRRRGGAAIGPDLCGSQIDAKRRFDAAIEAAGPGLCDILWRVVCAGEGMRDPESALG